MHSIPETANRAAGTDPCLPLHDAQKQAVLTTSPIRLIIGIQINR